jgi:hypothetical protein
MTNPIEALIDNDVNGFRSAVHDILMDKLGVRLELEKTAVAATLFGKDNDENADADEVVVSQEDNTHV